jgi:simple sugar transport system ATP-binding protein
VHRRIVQERDRGAAVVLVSTELDEVLGLADRIAVMFHGRIAGEVPPGTPAEEIGLLMAGHTDNQPSGETPAGAAAGGTR